MYEEVWVKHKPVETLKGTNQSINFKVVKSTANITVCVQNRSKEAEDEGRERGRGTEKISLNMGCDKKMRRRQN